jgi:hypothetical protein
MVTKLTIELQLFSSEGLPTELCHPLNSGIELAIFVTNTWPQLPNHKQWTKTGCIFERLIFINVFHLQYVQVHLLNTELRLLGSEGINNHKLLHFLLFTALQYPLACYKLLYFPLLTVSFHLHP